MNITVPTLTLVPRPCNVQVQQVIDIVTEASKTGEVGDGKYIIYPHSNMSTTSITDSSARLSLLGASVDPRCSSPLRKEERLWHLVMVPQHSSLVA